MGDRTLRKNPRKNPRKNSRKNPRTNPFAVVLREPLFRLLAINLAIGIAAAALMIGGLLALNPFGLRTLILADRAGGAAIGLLLFGFVITFGSTAMGTAIMTLGGGGSGGPRKPVTTDAPAPVKILAR